MVHKILSVTGVWLSHEGPDDAGWRLPELSNQQVSLYNFIFTAPAFFLKSQYEEEPDQN